MAEIAGQLMNGVDVMAVNRRNVSTPKRRKHAKDSRNQLLYIGTGPKAMARQTSKGAVKAVVLDAMKLGEPDARRRRRPEATGETITLECDQVIVAVGVSPNPLVPQSIEGLNSAERTPLP